MSLPKKVFIREVGPREGFQTLEKVYPSEQKIELIHSLSGTGLREIEVASFVRPDLVPQMADAEEVIAGLLDSKTSYTALYLNQKGYQRAVACENIETKAWLHVAASETFLKRNSNTTIAEAVNRIPSWLSLFKQSGRSFYGLVVSTAFGCNYEGAVSDERLLEVIASVLEEVEKGGESIQEISLADTMGWGNPEQIRRLVPLVKTKSPKSTVSLHLHDTRGSGMANVYAGLLAGVDIFDTSIGGIGGCPFAKGAAGNVSTEDVTHLFHSLGVETGLDLDALVRSAKLAEKIVGQKLPGKFYRSS